MPITHIFLLQVLFPLYSFYSEIKKCLWWGKQPAVKDWCLTSLPRENCSLKKQPFMRPFNVQPPCAHPVSSGTTKGQSFCSRKWHVKVPRQTSTKNPHPGSEIVCTTVRHKVIQANPGNPGKGSISRVMQVARFLLSCLKTPFFQASQPDSYQAPCLDTPHSCPARSIFISFLNIQSRVGAQESQ